jgi:hypothetical protein
VLEVVNRMDERAKTFSPFSARKSYGVRWGKEPSTIKTQLKMNEIQTKALKRLHILKIATKVQLAKQLNPGNIRRGKHHVDALKSNQYIVQHLLQDKETGSQIPFYSLSYQAAGRFGAQSIKPMDVEDIVKHLLLSQLFVRFYELDLKTEALPFPSPFNGAFSVFSLDFRIAIIRGSIQPIIKHFFYHHEEMRTLVVVERLEEAQELKQFTDTPLRVTTDYDLLKSDLSTGFYRLEGQNWVKEVIPIFKKKEKGMN